mgnify:CR=1 FL=1
MNTCSIVSAFYYIGDTKFTYKDVTNFVDKMNNTKGKIDFCSIDALKEILGKLNTRLIDRQSLSLEAAIKIAENENFLNNLNRSKLSIFAGSYTSSVYPSAIFNLSTKGKGPNFVNATEFTNTVGNAAVSRACIWNQFRGEAYAISEGLHSGLNAVVDAYTNIKYNETNDALSCATEEVGAAVVLIQKESPNHKAIACVKNVDSSYIANINEIESYFNNLENKFNVKLGDVDVYLSGNFDKVNYIFKMFEGKGVDFQKIINKNLWSLAPLVDIGRCLHNYKNGLTKDSIIVSIDKKGFVASAQLTRGEC